MYKIEIEQIKTKVGWFYRDEFFETDEWVEFDNETEYNKEVKRLKKLGFKVYYHDDYLTLFI
jgi:hypothetical protein